MSNENRRYYGVTIDPIGPNASGMRWTALIEGYGFVRADTLDGIKSIIRAKIAKQRA